MSDHERRIVPCPACKAEIFFIKTPAGKAAPLDAKPVKVWVGRVLKVSDDLSLPVHWALIEAHTSHFATCPFADRFRKQKSHY